MNRINIWKYSLIMCLCASVAWATTPSITDVSGVVSQGETLTITGTTMMDLNTTNWTDTSVHASFEEDTDLDESEATLNDDNWMWLSDVNATNTLEYQQSIVLHGSNAVEQYMPLYCPEGSGGENPDCGHLTLYQTSSEFGSHSDLYLSGYNRYDWTYTPTEYLKFLLSDGPYQFYWQPMNAGNDPEVGWIYKHGDDIEATGVAVDCGSLEWHHWEVRMKRSSPALYQIWWDGEQIVNESISDSGSFSYMEWGVVNMSGQLTGSTHLWMDAFVTSTARIYPWTLVEIGDGSNHGTATLVTQSLESISDTSIEIETDLTGLGAGPYWLFVTNNKQETSSGYSLAGGAEINATFKQTGTATISNQTGTAAVFNQ